MKQLNFDFVLPTDYSIDSLAIGQSNFQAVELLKHLESWSQKMAFLTGPKGSGKTHHSQVWANINDAKIVSYRDLDQEDLYALLSHGALVIEDIDAPYQNDTALFHAINMVLQTGAYLLITSEAPISGLKLETPDLLSRLRMALPITLDLPNDDMLMEIFWKLVNDRQLEIDSEFAEYVLDRSARDVASLEKVIQQLEDAVALSGKSLRKKQVSEILNNNDYYQAS